VGQVARVVLVGLPALTQDILRVHLESAGIRVTTALKEELAAIVNTAEADFVIAGRDELTPAEIRDLLQSQSRARALTVSGDGRETVLYELRPTQSALGGLSRSVLLQAIGDSTATRGE
jgi:hypothetical protein